MFRLRSAATMAAFLSIVIAVGCGGGSSNNGSGGSGGGGGTGGGGGGTPPPPPPPTMPTVTNFTLSPAVAGTGANGVGQFVNFTWTTANATSLTVTPTINGDDQAAAAAGSLPGHQRARRRPRRSRAVASNGSTNSQPATVTLTVVPVTLSSSVTTIHAGNTVTLTYGGPNNNSTWPLLIGGKSESHAPADSDLQRQHLFRHLYHQPAKREHHLYRLRERARWGTSVIDPSSPLRWAAHHLTLTANPQNIQPGGSSTLTWTIAERICGDHRLRGSAMSRLCR